MESDILSVSWLGKRLEVVLGKHKPQVTEGVSTVHELTAALEKVVVRYPQRPKEVIWVVDQPSIFHFAQDLPKTDDATTRQLLKRVLNTLDIKPETSCLGYWSAASGSAKNPCVAFVFPKEIVETIRKVSEAVELQLIGVFSPAAVWAEKAKKFAEDREVLVITEVGAALYLLLFSATQAIQLVRVVPEFAANEKLDSQIERTLLYVRQKMGQDLQLVYVSGDSLAQKIPELPALEGIEVQMIPLPRYATDDLPLNVPYNLSPASFFLKFAHQALSWVWKASACVAIIGLLLSVGILWEKHQTSVTQNRLAYLQEQKNKETAEAYLLGTDLPVIETFLKRLSSHAIPEMTLSGVSLLANNGHLAISLEGAVHTSNPSALLKKFTQGLVAKPLVGCLVGNPTISNDTFKLSVEIR